MSLEESMKELAESNLTLAKSLSRYAEVVEKYGLKIESANNGGAEPEGKPEKAPKEEKQTPAQKKAAEKAAAAAKAAKDDDDGFDAPAPAKKAKKLTHDDVKAKLLEIRDAAGDKQPALDLIGEHGYSAIPDIQEKDFDAIHADAVKWLEENVE